jgi:phospholipase/lecithinase/hemolysin
MKVLRGSAAGILTAVLLAACGGGDDAPAPEKINYTQIVSFGDSLSDVGSYATPGLVATTGGGKYTVNGAGAQLWVERLAATLQVPAPCAAQTGLQSVGPLAGFAAPVTNNPGCYAYGQGGSRVTNPIGIGNVATLPGESSGALGALTVPVLTQISNHLMAAGGSFSGTEMVTVLAGANDLFVQIGTVQATVAAGGNAQAAGQAATAAMGLAGGELAAYIKNLIVAKGAKRVIVVGIPDVSATAFGLAQSQATRDLIQVMSFTFNSNLQYGLSGIGEVLYVDLYSVIQNWSRSPAQYGLSNVAETACNLAVVSTSLFCTAATTVPGDVSRYLFADTVHPTPYGHELFTNTVIDALNARGWR